ncbi:MAG: nicotinamidase [Patescibacteria group bacterium]
MKTSTNPALPIPPLFEAKNAENWGYNPSSQKVFEEAERWRAAHTIAPVKKSRIHVLGIDLQKDFCFPEGSLYVGARSGRGAIDDNVRFAEFIYRNLGVIDDITLTLDTHYPFQIFFPSFWLKEDGSHPSPHTMITVQEIRQGIYRPNPAVANWIAGDANPSAVMAFLNHQVEHYCAELEKSGKYTLYLWPYHCLLGTEGHALTGVINEARLFHAFARGRQSLLEIKGGHPLTENYSVFKPEVTTRYDGAPLTEGLNTKLLLKLTNADMLIIAGQAASHCVKSSIDDLLDDIMARDRSLAEKVYILRDCTSAVVVPGVVDYTVQAESSLDRYAKAGMHVVLSTDPMDTWK